MKSLARLVLLLLLPASFCGASEDPRNVILMIADGAGYQHFTACSIYKTGASNGLACMDFPVRLSVMTFSASGWGYDPQAVATNVAYLKMYPTDSAAAATAMATGNKTSNRSLGMDREGRRLSNAVEVAVAAGRVAGLVTSVPFSHATPAGFSAHQQDRDQYAGIARQMLLESPVTVLMGGGNPAFDESGAPRPALNFDYVGGKELWDRLSGGQPVAGRADGAGSTGSWTLVSSREGFQALATGRPPERVLGVAPVYRTLQQERKAAKDWNGDGSIDGRDKAAEPPFGDPLTPSVPTLAEMALGALNVLESRPAKGFFLMIEGGAGDWASHNNEPGRLVEEMADFDGAIGAVCGWVEAHGGWERNLVIVTADHETGWLQLGGGPHEKGRLPSVAWGLKDHTNQLVPLFAKGAGAERLAARRRWTDAGLGPVIDNTDIGRVLLDLLGRP